MFCVNSITVEREKLVDGRVRILAERNLTRTFLSELGTRAIFLGGETPIKVHLGSGDMARELHVCLIRYFARLEKLDDKWKELSQKAERPLEVLANRAEQLRHVTNEEIDGAEDSVDKETRERLIFKILMGFEEEIALLSDILTQFNDANQGLKNYLVNLENARSKVSLKDETMQELIKGTPYRPTLELLLEWAVEGFQFFHNMYLRISDCMKLIDYKEEETINNLTSSFMEEKRGRKNINRILAFTQFLAKEILH